MRVLVDMRAPSWTSHISCMVTLKKGFYNGSVKHSGGVRLDEIKAVTAVWSGNKPRLLTCAFKWILKMNRGLKYTPLKNVAYLSDLLRVTGGRQLFPHCAAVTERCITTFHNAIITGGCSDALLLPSCLLYHRSH